jgi:hypothetical protein
MSLLSEFTVVMYFYDFHIKQCSVRLYLQLYVGGLMSYIICVCLRVVCPIHIVLCYVVLCCIVLCCVVLCCVVLCCVVLCCVFVLFVFIMFAPMLPVSMDCPFLIPLQYSLTFILDMLSFSWQSGNTKDTEMMPS